MELYLLVGVFTLLTSIGFYLPVPLTNIHPDRPLPDRLVGALQLTATGECAARIYNYLSTSQRRDADAYVLGADPKIHEIHTTYTPILDRFQQDTAQRTLQDFQEPPQTVTIFVTSTITDHFGAGQTIMPDNIYEVPTNPEWVLSRWIVLFEDAIVRHPNMYTTVILLFAFGTWLLSRSRNSKISESHNKTPVSSKGTDTEFVQALTRLFELISGQMNVANTTSNMSETFNASLKHVQEQVNQLQSEQRSGLTSARFASLSSLLDDLKNKMAFRTELEELSAKVETSNTSLQSLKEQVGHLLESPHFKPTPVELAFLINQVPDTQLKFTSKADFDQLFIKSTEMMDTLDLQDVKLQQAVDRWNEFTTWLQELQENMQSLRVGLETKGKEVKDLAMGFANLKENQKEDLQVAQRTLKDTQTAILELKKKITSSSKRTDELVREIDSLKVQTNNNQKTEMSTVVLADQIDKLQAKAASSEEAIRKLNREWELWMHVDDVSETGGSMQDPNTQVVGIRSEVESSENIANTKTGDLDTLKHGPQESNNRTDEIQEKLKTHEAAVQRLSDELEALRNDKQDPINQFELLQNKIGTCEEATNTLVRGFEKFKNTTLESKSQSGELRGKLKSHEEILQRLSNDLRELNNKKDSNNEFKELVEKIRSCDAAIEGLTKELETKKNDQQGSQPATETDMKIEKLKSTLNQVDTIALTTRCDVDRITTQIKEFGLSTQACRTLLTQQGIEIFKIREKLGITTPPTSPLDIERGMVQKDVAKSAAMFAQVSSGKKSTKDNGNEPPQTSTVPGDDKPSPSTVTSETQLKEKLSWRDATSASEGTTSNESAKPSTQSTASTSLASAPVASTPAPKRQAPKQRDKNNSRWDPAYVESADIPEVEEKISQAAPGANPGLKGDITKESGDPSKQITSSSKSSAYPPSSDPASKQPDKNMSRRDPAYVGPEGAFSHNKKATKKKTFRK